MINVGLTLASLAIISQASNQIEPTHLRLDLTKPATYSTFTTLTMTIAGTEEDGKVIIKSPGKLTLTPDQPETAKFAIEYDADNSTFSINPRPKDFPEEFENAGAEIPIPNMSGSVNGLASMNEVIREGEDAEEGSGVLFGEITKGLQGIVFPDQPVRPGDLWEKPLNKDGLDAGMALLFAVSEVDSRVKFYYVGNQERNGRTYAQIRMTMNFGIYDEETSSGSPFLMSLSAGYVYFVDIETGTVRFMDGVSTFKFRNEDQVASLTVTIKTVTDLPNSSTTFSQLGAANEPISVN